MILVCKDLKFNGKTLSAQGYSSLNFDNDTTLPSLISREMDSSDMNFYRPKTNGFGISYTDTLNFDLHIAKAFEDSPSQDEMEFSPEEYDALVSWLSSPNGNEWMEITTENSETVLVCGYFSNIEPYDNWGICYGAKCSFIANSPFAYIKEEQEETITGSKNFLVNNTSSETYGYVYPVVTIKPTKNEDIFVHNLSDSTILENDSFTSSTDLSANISTLQQKITSYATLNGYTVDYILDSSTQDLKLICNNTGILFYLTDKYGVQKKCVAYYLSNQYYICQGGFFYCTVSQGLNIEMDCENLGFYDSLNRPVLFTDLDIQDEDEIYWLRFIHGNNTLSVSGNITLTITYMVPRKGMLI